MATFHSKPDGEPIRVTRDEVAHVVRDGPFMRHVHEESGDFIEVRAESGAGLYLHAPRRLVYVLESYDEVCAALGIAA